MGWSVYPMRENLAVLHRRLGSPMWNLTRPVLGCLERLGQNIDEVLETCDSADLDTLQPENAFILHPDDTNQRQYWLLLSFRCFRKKAWDFCGILEGW